MPWMSINQWKKKNGIGKGRATKKKASNSKKDKKAFKLLGYDTFSSEWYNLSAFSTELAARKAGLKRLAELEITQPSKNSGGQGAFGIQDQVFIEGPDGQRHRVLP